jgi:hypothetical protein
MIKKHYDFSGDQSGGGVMKNIPKTIYLQIDADGETPNDFKDLSGISWCADKIYDNDIEYVLSSELAALKEENEKLRDELKGLAKTTGMVVTVQGKTLVEGVDFTCIGGTIVLAKHVFT